MLRSNFRAEVPVKTSWARLARPLVLARVDGSRSSNRLAGAVIALNTVINGVAAIADPILAAHFASLDCGSRALIGGCSGSNDA